MNQFKKFTIKITALTIGLSLAGVALSNYANIAFSAFPLIIVLFYITSLIVYQLVKKISAGRPQKFIPMYTLISGAKLLFYAFSLLVFFLIFRVQAVPIAITFGFCYFSFALVEVYSLVKDTK